MAKILVIAPYQGLKDLFIDINQDFQKDIHVEVGDLYKGLLIAQDLEDQGFDVIISRGATARLLRAHCRIPVIEVKISGYDILRTLTLVKGFPGKIGLMSYMNTVQGADAIGTLLEMNLTFFPIHAEEEVEKEIQKALKEDIQVMIGDVISTSIATRLGLHAILITSGKESVIESIHEAEQMAFYTKKEKTQRRFFEGIFQNYFEGLVALDSQKRIAAINEAAEKLLHVQADQVIGKSGSEVFSFLDTERIQFGSRTIVEEEVYIQGEELFVSLYGIQVEEEFIGSVVKLLPVRNIQKAESRIRNRYTNQEYKAEMHYNHLVAHSEVMKETIREAKSFSRIDVPIFIYGEPGSGKQSLAQAIHNSSSRKEAPFVFLNCEAYSEEQLEIELFGQDGMNGRVGAFELAHGGTLFIDAIGKLPLSIQAKLINVFQEKKITRVIGTRPIPVDVRVISAHEHDLKSEIQTGEFRKDLYYLMNRGVLHVPPLRERLEDIDDLVRWFIASNNPKLGKQIVGFRPDLLSLLKQVDWPGNVQQLKTVVEKMCVVGEGPYVEKDEVQTILEELLKSKPKQNKLTLIDVGNKTLEQIEQEVILLALQEADYNQSFVAKRLGINRSTLWRKIKDIEK